MHRLLCMQSSDLQALTGQRILDQDVCRFSCKPLTHGRSTTTILHGLCALAIILK
jgi:hypothetical protein